MKETVAVLGCGPAGLIAAHTAAQEGHRVMILSAFKEKSPISGAQFLHQPIEGISTEESTIHFHKRGTREGYALKVYDDPKAPCSWDAFPSGETQMWSMRETYDRLWSMYHDKISVVHINPDRAATIARAATLTISTIPAIHLCSNSDHRFPSAKVWIRDDAPAGVGNNEIVYSGDPVTPWYRASRIDGIGSTEFGHWVPDAREGVKPLLNDCACLPEIVRAGRFGQWEKGILVHHVEPVVKAACRVVFA